MIVLIIIIALVGGVICGGFVFTPEMVAFLDQFSKWVLYALMFSVGISVGANGNVFRKMREQHIKILVIPVGIIAGSILGGVACIFLLGYSAPDALAIASGLGWYSLSGVLVTSLGGATIGSVAFLANLMREIFSFMIIPFLAKRFNHYTAIAPCAATSEDTTLPMLRKYTSEEVVLVGVVNGVICSAFAPILINFFYSVF